MLLSLAGASRHRSQSAGGGREQRVRSSPCLTEACNPAKVQIADLLAQGVAVQSKNLGCLDLIAARPGERGGDQGRLEVVEHPVIQPDLRARAAKRVKEIS